jgi:hypothetical protein
VFLAGRQECRPILQPAGPRHRARRSQIEGRSDKGSCARGISEVMLREQRDMLGYKFRSCLTPRLQKTISSGRAGLTMGRETWNDTPAVQNYFCLPSVRRDGAAVARRPKQGAGGTAGKRVLRCMGPCWVGSWMAAPAITKWIWKHGGSPKLWKLAGSSWGAMQLAGKSQDARHSTVSCRSHPVPLQMYGACSVRRPEWCRSSRKLPPTAQRRRPSRPTRTG